MFKKLRALTSYSPWSSDQRANAIDDSSDWSIFLSMLNSKLCIWEERLSFSVESTSAIRSSRVYIKYSNLSRRGTSNRNTSSKAYNDMELGLTVKYQYYINTTSIYKFTQIFQLTLNVSSLCNGPQHTVLRYSMP